MSKDKEKESNYQVLIANGRRKCEHGRCKGHKLLADVLLRTKEGSAKLNEFLCLPCLNEFYSFEINKLAEELLAPAAVSVV